MAAHDEVVWAVDWGEVPVPVAEPAQAESAPAPAGAPPPLPSPPVLAPASRPTSDAAMETSKPVPPQILEPTAASPRIAAKPLVRGQRLGLSDIGIADGKLGISVRIATPRDGQIDVTCVGLDARGQLSDERYFVFYNQRATPCGSVTLVEPANRERANLRYDLSKVPAIITRLMVVASIDGTGTMGDLSPSTARVQTENGDIAEFAFTGSDFGQEKALIILELYRKGEVWRIAALGQGFVGGLAELLAHFGAKVE